MYGGRGCFYNNQLVYTLNGCVPISKINIGDVVYSYNEITGEKELKKVLNTFNYNINEPVYSVTLKNNKKIIATFDHKFFFGGSWISLKDIISLWNGNNVEKNTRFLTIRSEQYGGNKNIQLEKQGCRTNNEAINERWIPTNNVKRRRWEVSNYKGSQNGGFGIFRSTTSKNDSKSQELYKTQQQGGEFRVDDCIRKYNGCLSQRQVFSAQGRTGRELYSKRASCKRDSRKIQTKGVYKGYVSQRIWSETLHNKGYNPSQELELADIKSVEVLNNITNVFDIEVEGNNNFYLDCGKKILVHNSSKSDYCAKKLIYRCLTEKYFRYILVRNTYAAIKDSSYQTIKDIIYDLGLQNLFEFKLQPLEIHCVNGNCFYARGCDDATKLKSIKDPTGVWYEEDIPSENDFITITTSIRTTKADYLQEIFTINPEVEGQYQDHWFWKRFFKDKLEKSFSDVTVIEIDNDTKAELTYTTHHSTYKDNKWIPNEFIAFLKNLKVSNPYYYTIYCLGEWGNRAAGGLFYKLFNRAKNVDGGIGYKPELALHITFDFNVNPYMSCSIWQVVGKVAYCIDEIAAISPKNTTKGVCEEFIRRYNSHGAGLFIYGDPSGRNEDTRSEKGFNDYVVIQTELSQFKPVIRVALKHPPVVMRGNFINTVFNEGFDGANIVISDKCTHVMTDLLFLKEAADGTKLKEKVKDKESGVTHEKYGHFSDGMDYLICEVFKSEFYQYQHGKGIPQMKTGRNVFNEKYKY